MDWTLDGDTIWIEGGDYDRINLSDYGQNSYYTSSQVKALWRGLAIPGRDEFILPTNCKNCAAPLHSSVCEYCKTKY